jgi:TatD DNase family protein
MAAILSGHPKNRGVIHSFTGGPAEARRYLSIGWHLAFNGVVTFKHADDVRAAARLAPAERVLIETDSPYLAPVPKRGARCEPAFLPYTLRTLAEVRGEAVDALEERTTMNARALFGLTETP